MPALDGKVPHLCCLSRTLLQPPAFLCTVWGCQTPTPHNAMPLNFLSIPSASLQCCPLGFLPELPMPHHVQLRARAGAAQHSWWDVLPDALAGFAFLCSSVQNQVDEVIDVMQENITKVIERGERLDDLQDKSGVVLNALLYLCFSLHLFPTAGPGCLVSAQKVSSDRCTLCISLLPGNSFPALGCRTNFMPPFSSFHLLLLPFTAPAHTTDVCWSSTGTSPWCGWLLSSLCVRL